MSDGTFQHVGPAEVGGIGAEATVSKVQELMAEVLGTSVPADGSFISYGGDSFLAVVLIGRIEEEWGAEVDFLEALNSTPESLARSVNGAIGPARQKGM